MTRRLLLTGATGLIGSHTAASLAREGLAVRALVRDPAKLADVLGPLGLDPAAVEAVRGDVTDPESVAVAATGCHAAIHCAGRFSHDLGEADALREVNVRGAEVVLRAAVGSGLALRVGESITTGPAEWVALRATNGCSLPAVHG